MIMLALGAILILLIFASGASELLFLVSSLLCILIPIAFYAFLLFYGRV